MTLLTQHNINKYATLIKDQQRGFGVWLEGLFKTPSTPGGSKRVDHINGAGKEHRVALEAGGIAQRRRQVGFTLLMTMPF